MRIVKKYSNRRLYDTAESRYITLEELAESIRGGADVKVVDAKTNEDLTQSVLAQIVVESRGAARLLPPDLLVQMIRMGDDALAEFIGQWMVWALEVYLKSKQRNERMWSMSPFDPRTLANMNPFASAWMNAAGASAPPPGTPPQPSAPPAPDPEPEPEPEPEVSTPSASASDVDELRAELDEMKALLRQLAEK